MSNPGLNSSIIGNPDDAAATAACANNDLTCKPGVGAQQDASLTPAQRRAVGEYFGQASTNYQRMAGMAVATGNSQAVLLLEIASGITGLLEQAFTPNVGESPSTQ